jgi:hypothetical protein
MNALDELIELMGRYDPSSYGLADRAKQELVQLHNEIDKYDKVCTEIRNKLTSVGIPELTEDRLAVIPLAERVQMFIEKA